MKTWLGLLLGFGLAASLSASMAEGNQAMAAKDYASAAKAYESVAGKEPLAHRQAGTANYYLGDKSKALAHWEAHLAASPNDAATQRYVTALRNQGVQPAALGGGGATMPAGAGVRQGFGARLGVGYAVWGASSGVGFDLASTASEHPFIPAGGLSYGGEFLWAFHPLVELGMGVDLIGNSASYSSKNAAGTFEESTKAESSGMPISFTLYTHLPSQNAWHWILGFGPMYVLSANGTLTEVVKMTGTGDTQTTVTKSTYDGGLGWRGFVGGEYAFSPNFSILAGFDVKTVDLYLAKTVAERTYSWLPNKDIAEYEYGGSPKAPDDYSVTTSGTTTTYKYKVAKTETQSFSRFAPVISATYRF